MTLPDYEEDAESYDPTELEAIFSKERYPADNVGDINADGKCDIADVVLLQKYLLTIKDALPDWKAGDLDQTEKLNACDLTLLKQLLMK